MTLQLSPGADRVLRTALLGVQFRDALDGRVVADGLRVDLQDLWQPWHQRALVANRSGIFALHAFPGLSGFEDDAEAPSPPDEGRFRLTATDSWGRYLPTALAPPLPAGLWGPGLVSPWTSPPTSVPHVPLYAATTRLLPGSVASLRAELRRAGSETRPAAWARVEAWLGSTWLGEGVADAAGRLLLAFPLPRPRPASLGTSPAGTPAAFEWPLTLRAHWSPAFETEPLPLFDAIQAQPEVALLAQAGPPLPVLPLGTVILHAGESLVVTSPPSSFLYVAA